MNFKEYNNIAGIYKWQNKINGKCYIGQSIDLGSRLRHHINNYKHHRYDNPLYRAFNKYGIDSFTVDILYFQKNPTPEVKQLLDLLEIGYIEKYNSYGNTGYNQTRGGDAGILGYKFTKEQRERVSKNSTISAKALSKQIVLYNIDTKQLLMFQSISSAAKRLKTNHSQISRLCSWKQLLFNKCWIGAYNEQDVYKRELYIKEHHPIIGHKSSRAGIIPYKYSIEVYKDSNCVFTFENTTEANDKFFHFKDKRVVLNTLTRTINRGTKYKNVYTFKLINKRNNQRYISR